MQEAEKNNLMFSLLQCSLFGNPEVSEISIPEDTDWSVLLEELQEQTVHGLVEPILDALPIPDPAVKEAWRQACIRQQMRWYQVANVQQNLVTLLDEAGIPSVIIKGTAAGIAYPKPTARCPGDIDILVKRSNFQRAADLLQESGYTFVHDDNEGKHHHFAYQNDGVSIELHHRLGIVSETLEDQLVFFESGVEQGVPVQIDGFSFRMFPRLWNGLSLLFHINQHLRSGLGLRQIIDWMMFVDQELTDGVWETEFQPYLAKHGMETLAITVTAMAQKYLGLSRSIHWANSADEATCDELMGYILEKGNFGKKCGEEGHIASVFLVSPNPVRLFKRLQKGGLLQWKAAKKHKFLRPFAWLYQSIRILGLLIKHKKSPHQMKELKDVGAQQRNLIQRLGLDSSDRSSSFVA